jgi:hypothetical protein
MIDDILKIKLIKPITLTILSVYIISYIIIDYVFDLEN